MTPERMEQIGEALEKALALARNKRGKYLDDLCANDSELRQEVESLLGSHEEAGTSFLATPAAGLGKCTARSSIRAGCRIGVYNILEQIGQGGMGEVFSAVRADGQYEKKVAIKLVRSGYDTESILERFRNERQIQASLDHPNIARLLDGGTTEDGIPYFVMELVEGAPIDNYCDARKLNITSRLQLFRQVCGAVQYAHQRLIIHRDIKPSNILVTSEGSPKLLDFGIARFLDTSGRAEATLLRPMTPEYASPEQIRGEPITTATDVYSLGVVLYQLLTGHSPYRMDTRKPPNLAEAITHDEPVRPSISVQWTANLSHAEPSHDLSPENVSSTREPSPLRLQQRLQGDIDFILLKALRKEPSNRYASVDQFSEDIRNHLEGLPVFARKGTWSYRAGKFARRHRAGVAAASLVLITLIAGVIVTVRAARIARQQAQIAQAERARAEKRFDDVRKLANSLIFEIHDSIQGLPGATPSRKLLLDRAVEYLDKLSQDSGGDVDLQRELAWAYQRLATVQGDTTQSNLGQVGAAEASNQKALALFEAAAEARPGSTTDQLNLAMAYRGRAFFDVYEKTGLAEINQALAVTEPLMRTNGDNLDVENERAQEEMILADIQDAIGDRLQAIESFRKVLDLRQEILLKNPAYPGIRQGVAKVTIMLADQTGRFGSREEGLRLMNEGIAEFEALVKETAGDPGLIRELSAAMGRRSQVELMQGDIADARGDLRRSRLPIERLARLDPENKMLQSDLWADKFHEGRTLAVAGRNTEALLVLEQAFRGYQSLHLEADVWPGPPLMQAWIGETQARTHNFIQALKSFEAAAAGLAEDQANYDDARCDLAMVDSKIGYLLLRMGKLKEAATEFQKALDTAKLSFSIEHADIPALYAAADAYAGMGDAALAKARKTNDDAARAKLFQEAREDYGKGLSVWKHIANPSKISGNGYAATTEPGELSSRLASSAHLVP